MHAQLVVIGREIYVGTGHLPEVVSDDDLIPIYQAFTIGFDNAQGVPAAKLRIKLPLLGSHQQLNAAVALAALRALAGKGIQNRTRRPSLSGYSKMCPVAGEAGVIYAAIPWSWLDGAHNVEFIVESSSRHLDHTFHRRPVILVFGTSRDKDIPGILGRLRPWDR